MFFNGQLYKLSQFIKLYAIVVKVLLKINIDIFMNKRKSFAPK